MTSNQVRRHPVSTSHPALSLHDALPSTFTPNTDLADQCCPAVSLAPLHFHSDRLVQNRWARLVCQPPEGWDSSQLLSCLILCLFLRFIFIIFNYVYIYICVCFCIGAHMLNAGAHGCQRHWISLSCWYRQLRAGHMDAGN